MHQLKSGHQESPEQKSPTQGSACGSCIAAKAEEHALSNAVEDSVGEQFAVAATTSPKQLSAVATTTLNPIEAAIELRASLRDSLDKTNQLITSLKQHKKQSRLVQTTLASLKQLQAVA